MFRFGNVTIITYREQNRTFHPTIHCDKKTLPSSRKGGLPVDRQRVFGSKLDKAPSKPVKEKMYCPQMVCMGCIPRRNNRRTHS